MPETRYMKKREKGTGLKVPVRKRSGALLISAKPRFASKIIECLRQQHIHASIIGEFMENPHERIMIRKDGNIQALPRPLSDHLWLALARK